jgi:NH3-dependent NAD+ synthetase
MGIPSFSSLDVNCCYYKTYLLHLQHEVGICKEIVKKNPFAFMHISCIL